MKAYLNKWALAMAMHAVSTPADAACFELAASKHGVSAQLLCAIAWVESSGRASALNESHVQRTGSVDIGLMQINSSHLPALARFSIGKKELTDGCISAHVGAWLLSDLFKRHGQGWEAVGAYNAACTQLKGAQCRAARDSYIKKVQKALPRCQEFGRQANTPNRSAQRAERELTSVDFDPADRRFSSFMTHDTTNE
jgi:soluble lytic murein transglycosylase-like protein